MGMSASQARYLSLTARKSNTEYQGQQINQQRTTLANESSNIYEEITNLEVPTPPSVEDYTTLQYSFTTSSLSEDGSNTTYTLGDVISTPDGDSVTLYSDESVGGWTTYGKSTGVRSEISEDDGSTVNYAIINGTSYQLNSSAISITEATYNDLLEKGASVSTNASVTEVSSSSGVNTSGTTTTSISESLYNELKAAGVSVSDNGGWITQTYSADDLTLLTNDDGEAATYEITEDLYNELYAQDASVSTKVTVNDSNFSITEGSLSGIQIYEDGHADVATYTDEDGNKTYEPSIQQVTTDETFTALLESQGLNALDEDGDGYYDNLYSFVTADGTTTYAYISSEFYEDCASSSSNTVAYSADDNTISNYATYFTVDADTIDTETTYYATNAYKDADGNLVYATGSDDEAGTITATVYQDATEWYAETTTDSTGNIIYVGEESDEDGNTTNSYYQYSDATEWYADTTVTLSNGSILYGNLDTNVFIQWSTSTKTTASSALVQATETNDSGRMTSISVYVMDGNDYTYDDEGNPITQTFELTCVEVEDEDAYDQAMEDYEYQKALYNQEYESLNAKTESIQAKDKKLELKLKQLDTEQSAISTEMDAVSKVIDDNVESTFKTFG